MFDLSDESLRSSFKEFFKVEAYNYQIEVAQHLLSGKSVVLQAPTGAGKTNTALFPYLYARQNLAATQFPRKMIYSVERRILVNNFHTEVEKILQESNLKAALEAKGEKLEATVLTGERPEDREMRGHMLFTTIDQTLSSFLLTPYSLSSRVANLNAGAVASSYLVFDEAHLFDPDTALPTLMWMLQTLKDVTPTLLMTATFSKPILDKLAKTTEGVVVTVSPEELKKIPAQATKKRYFQMVEMPLTGQAVIDKHQHRSIVVCNMVDRAQQLYDELEAAKDPATELIMLHSRFWQADRKSIEKELLKLFGKSEALKTGSAILVATQVIEVGVDITCENLHTELAPANTVLQRAGRCARHPNEEGTVWVYQVESKLPYEANKKQADKKPEDDKPQKEPSLFDSTFSTIKGFGSEPVTFGMEQLLIEQVHEEADKNTLAKIEANRPYHAGMIEEAINTPGEGHLSSLIRDADSRSILVHPKPEEMENPYSYESFSVFDGSFRGKLKWLLAQAEELGLDWAVKWPEAIQDTETTQEIERRPTQYRWNKLEADKQAKWQPIVVVNPQLVSYDQARGFQFTLNQGEPCQSKPVERQAREYSGYNYQRETYADHIKNVNGAYGYFKFDDEIAFAVSRLQATFGPDLPAGQIDLGIRLSFVFHDAGKLTEGWQGVGRKWQAEIKQPVSDPKIMLAHTDFDRGSQRDLQRDFEKKPGNKRPPHAAEGAYIAQKFIYNALGKDLYRPVVSAIARHHSPGADSLSQYKLHSGAANALVEALSIIEQGQPWNINPGVLVETAPIGTDKLRPNMIVKASTELELVLYMLIIRVLRLADQNSFSYYEAHKKAL